MATAVVPVTPATAACVAGRSLVCRVVETLLAVRGLARVVVAAPAGLDVEGLPEGGDASVEFVTLGEEAFRSPAATLAAAAPSGGVRLYVYPGAVFLTAGTVETVLGEVVNAGRASAQTSHGFAGAVLAGASPRGVAVTVPTSGCYAVEAGLLAPRPDGGFVDTPLLEVLDCATDEGLAVATAVIETGQL